MELYDVMRTTFACREFTGEPVPQDVLHRIIDNARFAPSGGNRQGWRIINITDPVKKERLADLSLATATFQKLFAAGFRIFVVVFSFGEG